MTVTIATGIVAIATTAAIGMTATIDMTVTIATIAVTAAGADLRGVQAKGRVFGPALFHACDEARRGVTSGTVARDA